MSNIDRPGVMLRSGIYAWKEVLTRTIDSEFVGSGSLIGEIEVPLLIEDKAGHLQPGITKQYILQKYRIGELVAYKEPGVDKIYIGYSLIHPIDKHEYDKTNGIEYALQIADNSFESVPIVPSKARESVAYFADRCSRYWKESVLPQWAADLKASYVDTDWED